MAKIYQQVNVFYNKNDAAGNDAVIIMQKESGVTLSEQSQISLNICRKNITKTVCFIASVTTDNYQVNCFNGDKLIQCCGHGYIAAAKVIFNDSDVCSININNNVKANRQESSKASIILELPRMFSQHVDIPDWVKKTIFFDSEIYEPKAAAVSRQKDGYLLLEYDSQLPLSQFKSMKLDLKKVCESTKRAIVILLFDQENNHVYLRYFAPQYGVTEDTATGSVMRFVGDYIENKYQCSHFDVSQCSVLGGFMMVECKDKHILITANVRLESD